MAIDLEEGNSFSLDIVATDEGGLESNSVPFEVGVQEEERSSDFNNDGLVNLDDLGIFASAFGSQQEEDNFNPITDLKGFCRSC